MLTQLPAVHGVELTTIEVEPTTVSVDKQLIDNYQVAELSDDGCSTPTCSSQQHLVETALLARLSFWRLSWKSSSPQIIRNPNLSIDQIKHNDHLISFYTGFPFFDLFLEFPVSWTRG